jgi:hypothetical protein
VAALARRPFAPRPDPETLDGVDSSWSPGADADQWWRTAAPRGRIMVVRDRAFLQWRFGSAYRLFALQGASGVAGYVAARIVVRAGLRVGMIVDCMAAETVAGVRLLTAAVARLREQGAAAAVGYFLPQSLPWRCARAAGFLRLPEALAPREYPVYVRVRSGDEHGPALRDPARWLLSMADSDLV